MQVKMTERDKGMFHGEFGKATRIAMSIIPGIAEGRDVDQLIGVSRSHMDGCTYLGEASLDFAEMFARLTERVVIRTSLNIDPWINAADRFFDAIEVQ